MKLAADVYCFYPWVIFLVCRFSIYSKSLGGLCSGSSGSWWTLPCYRDALSGGGGAARPAGWVGHRGRGQRNDGRQPWRRVGTSLWCPGQRNGKPRTTFSNCPWIDCFSLNWSKRNNSYIVLFPKNKLWLSINDDLIIINSNFFLKLHWKCCSCKIWSWLFWKRGLAIHWLMPRLKYASYLLAPGQPVSVLPKPGELWKDWSWVSGYFRLGCLFARSLQHLHSCEKHLEG